MQYTRLVVTCVRMRARTSASHTRGRGAARHGLIQVICDARKHACICGSIPVILVGYHSVQIEIASHRQVCICSHYVGHVLGREKAVPGENLT